MKGINLMNYEIGKINFVIGGVPYIKIYRFTFINFRYAKTFKILYETKQKYNHKTLFTFSY